MNFTQAEIDRFKDRHAIYDCLVRFARGLDRQENELLKSAFHDGATISHGMYSGEVSGFADFIGEYRISSGVVQATNRVNQALIEFTSDDSADVETYILSFLDTEMDGKFIARTVGGRYLDRFERRHGDWKVASRLYVMDWNSSSPSTVDVDGSYFGDLAIGRTDRKDQSFEYISLLL